MAGGQFLECAVLRDGPWTGCAAPARSPVAPRGYDALPRQGRLPQGRHRRPGRLPLVALMGLDDDRIRSGSVSVGTVVVDFDDHRASATWLVPYDVRAAGADGGVGVTGLDDDLLEQVPGRCRIDDVLQGGQSGIYGLDLELSRRSSSQQSSRPRRSWDRSRIRIDGRSRVRTEEVAHQDDAPAPAGSATVTEAREPFLALGSQPFRRNRQQRGRSSASSGTCAA